MLDSTCVGSEDGYLVVGVRLEGDMSPSGRACRCATTTSGDCAPKVF